MRLGLILCLSAGLAFATPNPAWRENSEYHYQIRGRTLTGLSEISDWFQGILYKADLTIQPRPDGHLQARITELQYAQVPPHRFSNDWRAYIPDSELPYKPMELSTEPFQLQMENGVIKSISFNKGISNWEANMIKGIVSQFQLKISEREESSTEFPSSFKVMEETVTGNTETTYKIVKMPEYKVLQELDSEKLLEEKQDGDVYEVTKWKNYTNSVELPSYFFGFAELEQGYPATNRMGDFFTRNSISRSVLVGKLNRYTIRHSLTISEILVNPTLTVKEKASVYSMVNVTLVNRKQKGEQLPEISEPQSYHSLVYSYGKPFDHSNELHERMPYQSFDKHQLNKIGKDTNMISRLRRTLEDTDLVPGSEESYKQEYHDLRKAPESPMLRFTEGYKGQSIKEKIDVVQRTKQLSEEVADELKNYEKESGKQTWDKFTTLTSLVRIMDYEEIKTVADELYRNGKQEEESDKWQVYRDAVAQAGTGPTLLVIQEWLQEKRIENVQASLVLSTMSKSVRQPSLQYMKKFFEIIQNPVVKSKWPVNDTAILTFTTLLRTVYVDRRFSSTEYPVKSFRNFRTEAGLQFLKETVIPYLTNELHKSIAEAETEKIHIYIKALGNIGAPEILSAYKPYLEGDKQSSQFQRLLMVLSLGRLTETYPQEALSTLVRIYFNTGETEENRIAAVLHIMRAKPSAELLQFMAKYTEMDKQEHVIAVVKSSIESLAELKGAEYEELRRAAQSARPLLTRKVYGSTLGVNYLHQRVIEELKAEYFETIQLSGSDDQYYPRGLKYSLEYNLAGLKKKLMNMQAMVTSIDELIRVFKQQTSSFSEEAKQQKEKSSQQMQHPWSSQRIAEILKLKPEEREQLEGYLYFEDRVPETMLPFDNRTIYRFVEEFGKYEKYVPKDAMVHFLKITNDEEMALAFPTEMGIPFLYTYDTPGFVRVHGHVKVDSTPLMNQDKLALPEHISFQYDLSTTMESNTQGHISFITPFESLQYLSGYKQHLHMSIPLKGRTEVDVRKMEIKMEMEKSEGKSFFIHRVTTPYLSKVNLLEFEQDSETHIIEQKPLRASENKFGEKQTGLALHVRFAHEKPLFDVQKVKELFRREGPVAAAIAFSKDNSIQRSDISIDIHPQQSSTRKLVVNMGYRRLYLSQLEKDSEQHNLLSWNTQEQQEWQNKESEERNKDTLEKIIKGIKHAKAESVDVSFEFQGDRTIKHTMNGAIVKSNINPKSRMLLRYRQQFDKSQEKSTMLSVLVENVIENTNELDLDISMRREPKMQSAIHVSFGENEKLTKIKADVQFRRSEERKEYLKQQPMYKQCRSEMSNGNKQLQACANITMASNLLDHIDVKLKHQDVPKYMKEVFRTSFYSAQYQWFPQVSSDYQRESQSEEDLLLHARFDPDLRSVNISVTSEIGVTRFEDIPVSELAKEIFVPHPMFHAKTRVMSRVLGLKTYRPFCVVDKTRISTFNNVTYPQDISDKWTVMFHYVPKQAREEVYHHSVTEQLKRQLENYVVLVKRRSSDEKEVKITFSTPETKFEVVDITLSPRKQENPTDARAKVLVNDKEMKIEENRSFDAEDGYIQIYTLPNGEVKAEIRDQFYIVFDGKRVKLSTMNGKFKDSIRGICGQFNDEPVEDFLVPENCYVQDHQKLIKSYEVEGSNGKEVREEMKSRKDVQCVRKNLPLYVDVVTPESTKTQWGDRQSSQCTTFKTRYVQQNGDVCFTIRPMPVCVEGCRPTGYINKNVAVHCIQKSSVAHIWKNQIDNGGNPDFSQKSESMMANIQLPQSCA